MRTSATTSNNPGRGFSLLEIMVVAALIGLLAAIAVPMISTGGGRSDLQRQADQLAAWLEQLNEQSLFLSELLAARLDAGKVVPLRYSHEESAFVAVKGRSGGLSPLEFDDGMRLEWELEQAERRGPDLREALGARLDDEEGGDASADGREEASQPEERDSTDSAESLPQLFFFPSGEVTPARLWLRGPDGGAAIELELNSIGRVARPEAGEDADAG